MTEREITFKAKVENIETVTDIVTEELEKAGCTIAFCSQTAIILDEVCGNIVRYSGLKPEEEITVILKIDEKEISLTFIDGGKPYDPTKKEDPDITLSADEREIGGLGIFIVKKLTDEMVYTRENDKNIFHIKKKIG